MVEYKHKIPSFSETTELLPETSSLRQNAPQYLIALIENSVLENVDSIDDPGGISTIDKG